MLEFILVLALILVLGFSVLIITSIFLAYVTQATYVEPLDGDELDD
jgi:hypothetical protein